ncbi:MFS transporter [Actinocatenispora thailandica]|uniref:MFS transporter n=1 Tax=Actinocatenispora thailandica TaxID=227318 RepID=A0A7R7HY80_9ACTN|nr:MFS transporter [Actinocatenispora thailandica]BCJ36306.1 MFS transporter [Actinocatenispora thailandica]
MDRRALVLVAVLLSTVTFPLTITGASVALPDIRSDLGAGLAGTQWVVNGYNATFAAFLVVTGSLADLLGRRRVYLTGLTLYVATGVASALSGNVLLLDAVRLLGGVGAAAAVTGGAALLSAAFPGPARARAFGLLRTMLGAGLAFGPSIGGLLVSHLGWRAVFAVPAGIASCALLLALAIPRPADRPPARRIDWAGGALFTGALLTVIAVLVEAPDAGFGHPVIIAGWVLAAALAVGFVAVERRADDPVVELRLLTNPRFASYATAAATLVVVLVPLLVYLPSYLISVAGVGAGTAGLWLLLLTGPTVLLPTVSGLVARWVPTVAIAVGAIVLCGIGALLVTRIGPHTGPAGLALPLILVGAGTGLTQGLLDGRAIDTVRAEAAGAASGLFQTSRLASETVGIAVVGAILAALSGDRLAGAGYTRALHVVGVVLAGVCVAGAIGVLALSRRRARIPSAATESARC